MLRSKPRHETGDMIETENKNYLDKESQTPFPQILQRVLLCIQQCVFNVVFNVRFKALDCAVYTRFETVLRLGCKDCQRPRSVLHDLY